MDREPGKARSGVSEARMPLANVGEVVGGSALDRRAHALDKQARDGPVAAMLAAPALARESDRDERHGVEVGHAQVLVGGHADPSRSDSLVLTLQRLRVVVRTADPEPTQRRGLPRVETGVRGC